MLLTRNAILSLPGKYLLAAAILCSHIITSQGQDLHWAGTITFDHTGAALEQLHRSAPHLNYMLGQETGAGTPVLYVVAEFDEPVDVAHIYVIAEDFNYEINSSVLFNTVDVETVLPSRYAPAFAFEGREVLGFEEKNTAMISGSIQRVVFTIAGVPDYSEPKIIAVGASSEALRRDHFTTEESQEALSSVREMKVNHVRAAEKTVTHTGTITYFSAKEDLGPNVNTVFEEVKPLISPDGAVLYFARKGHPANVNGMKDQDIYCSRLQDGMWRRATAIGDGLNDKYPNGVCSVSPDGSRLLLMNAYNKNGKAYDGVSVTQKLPQGWSMPEGQLIEGFVNYNAYQDFALNITGEVLLMSIENETSYGGQDLYVSFKKGDNTWTKPANLGAVINTKDQEYAPFMAGDDRTLYFSSDGHGGYGAGDILMSRRLGDSWTQWTEPVNIGGEVNTEDWEGYFTIPLQGDYAYFTSGGKPSAFSGAGEANEDIYRIAIREAIQPEPVIVLQGHVYDEQSHRPLSGNIAYETDQSRQALASDANTGFYKIVLPIGRKIDMLTTAKGYLPENLSEDFSGITEYTVLERDFYLTPMDIGQIFSLNNLFFVQSRAELLPESYPELNRIYDMLTSNPGMEIELGGHTDNTGVSAANLRLSRERAEAVRDYLIELGIEPGRMRATGYGEKKPVASNKDPETRKQNRRVEVKILKK